MNFSLPNELYTLAKLFKEAGCALFGVGGMVRNPMLGLVPSDYDICSAMTPDRVMELAEKNGIKAIPTGAAFGMVELHIKDQKFEHTTFRSDTYGTGGGHRPEGVRFSTDLNEDAFRRDFTVNAMYLNILTGEVIDPTGGRADLDEGILRATSADPDIIMGDDALRILRMVRFAGELGFRIHPDTFSSAKRHSEGLRDISTERIREELNKILLCDAKYNRGSVLAALENLDKVGALDIILPEVTRGRAVAQRKDYHRYDVLGHLFHAADEAPAVLHMRLAALLHDIGKPVVFEQTGRMYRHDEVGAELVKDVLLRLKYPTAVIAKVQQLVLHHMYDLRNQAKDVTLRSWFVQRGKELSKELIELRRADVRGSGYTRDVDSANRWEALLDRMERENVPFSEKELNVTGADITAALNIPPSQKVGRIKRSLLIHCASHPNHNKREILLKIAKDMVNNS